MLTTKQEAANEVDMLRETNVGSAGSGMKTSNLETLASYQQFVEALGDAVRVADDDGIAECLHELLVAGKRFQIASLHPATCGTDVRFAQHVHFVCCFLFGRKHRLSSSRSVVEVGL